MSKTVPNVVVRSAEGTTTVQRRNSQTKKTIKSPKRRSIAEATELLRLKHQQLLQPKKNSKISNSAPSSPYQRRKQYSGTYITTRFVFVNSVYILRYFKFAHPKYFRAVLLICAS